MAAQKVAFFAPCGQAASDPAACRPSTPCWTWRCRGSARKRISFFLEFSLCLSRACLGKMIIYVYERWTKKWRFSHLRRVGCVVARLTGESDQLPPASVVAGVDDADLRHGGERPRLGGVRAREQRPDVHSTAITPSTTASQHDMHVVSQTRPLLPAEVAARLRCDYKLWLCLSLSHLTRSVGACP